MFKNALRVGVPIAFATDAGVYPHGMNATEFGLMVDLGMSPAAALLAGTHESARLLGVEKEVGTLEPGKAADIVAVRGNVLSDIHATEHPVFVMRLGTSWRRRRGHRHKALRGACRGSGKAGGAKPLSRLTHSVNGAAAGVEGAGPVQYTARPAFAARA